MNEFNLMEQMQSAYFPGHSIETALICVHNDIIQAVDNKHGVILVLLELSATFDTVDYGKLMYQMQHRIGIGSKVLEWFHSFLTEGKHAVLLGSSSSNEVTLEYRVHQGSVIGLQLFTI